MTPALETLYAVSPGGIVMPCFEPVLTTTAGSPCAIMVRVSGRVRVRVRARVAVRNRVRVRVRKP